MTMDTNDITAAATSEATRRGETWLLGLAPVLFALGAATVFQVVADLPPTIAIHFDGSGTPDGSGPVWVPILMAAIAGVIALGVIMAVLRGDPTRDVAPAAIGFAHVISIMLSLIAIVTINVNQGTSDWTQADDLPGAMFAGALLVPALVAGLVAARLRAILPQPAPVPVATIPSLGLAPGERATWSEVITLNWMWAVGAIAAMVGVGLTFTTAWPAGIAAGVGGVGAALAFHRYRVRVSADGVRVEFGVAGWPRVAIPLDRVATARAEHIDPMKWGGWGYRGSLYVFGRAAMVHRRGPGLVLALKDDRHFAVTCDDPTTAAGLVNDLVDRREPSPH